MKFVGRNTSYVRCNTALVFVQVRDCSKKIEDLFAKGDPGDEKLAVHLNKMSAQVNTIRWLKNCFFLA